MRLSRYIVLGLTAVVLGLGIGAGTAAAAYDPVDAGVGVSIGVGDTYLHITGQTSPQAFVTIKDSDQVIGTVEADASGYYEKTFGAQTPGIHYLSVFARSITGLVGDSAVLTVNYREHETTDVILFLPTTIALSKTDVPPDTELLIRGETIPSGKVILLIDQDKTINVQSDDAGDWTRRIAPGELSPGNHSITAYVVDGNGTQSAPTAPRFFTILPKSETVIVPGKATQTTPANGRSTVAPKVPGRPTITIPRDNATTSTERITVVGLSDVRQQIEVWRNGRLMGSVLSDEHGGWSMPVTLRTGLNELTARTCNVQQCSPFAEGIHITYTPAADAPTSSLTMFINAYRWAVHTGSPVRISVTAERGQAPYTYRILWGDGNEQTVTSQDKITGFTHSYASAGLYGGNVRVQDAIGTVATAYFSVRAANDSPAQRIVPYLVATTLITTTAALGFYGIRIRLWSELARHLFSRHK